MQTDVNKVHETLFFRLGAKTSCTSKERLFFPFNSMVLIKVSHFLLNVFSPVLKEHYSVTTCWLFTRCMFCFLCCRLVGGSDKRLQRCLLPRRLLLRLISRVCRPGRPTGAEEEICGGRPARTSIKRDTLTSTQLYLFFLCYLVSNYRKSITIRTVFTRCLCICR